jgi:hypothetical protein
MNSLSKLFGNSSPSIIKNPFGMEHIERISMCMYRSEFDRNKIRFYANINFKNGNTTGSQEIEGENFKDLFEKVYEFCSTL